MVTGPKCFITIGFKPSGPADFIEHIYLNADFTFLMVKVVSNLGVFDTSEINSINFRHHCVAWKEFV